MMKKHLDRYARWAKGHNSWLVVTFDENAGGTVKPIPTIIVGDHVRPGRYAQKINHYTLLRTIEDATLPPRPGIEDLCQLSGPSRHERMGGSAHRPGRQASGQCLPMPWEASSAVVWRQAAIDLGSAGVFNHDHRPSVFGWSHAAIGGGQVAGPTHAHHVVTRVRQGHR